MSASLSRSTMPILRIGMAVFLMTWGVDKLVATEGSQGIFGHFYGIAAGPRLVQASGVAEILLAVLLAVGLFRTPVAWLQLAVNVISAAASWRQVADPWGFLGLTKGGTHLFLASIVVTAVAIVLVVNARDDMWTLDRTIGR